MTGQATEARLAALEAGRTVILDGGIGTEILRRGSNWASHLIQSDPDLVRQISADYIGKCRRRRVERSLGVTEAAQQFSEGDGSQSRNEPEPEPGLEFRARHSGRGQNEIIDLD